MGQIIIEIPQNVRRSFRITNEETAAKLLAKLERATERREKEEDEDILGLWSPPGDEINKKAA